MIACTQPYTLEHQRPNGRIIEVRGQPLPSGGVVIACRDVTGKRMAQATLESSERFMRGIIDSALDAFVSVDSSDRVLDWNSSAEKIRTEEPPVGKEGVSTFRSRGSPDK